MARRQFGVFTAAQAEAEGLSERIVRRRLEQGSWNRVVGVGLSSGTKPWSPEQLATAAQLTLPGAVVSHRTAGLLHDFPLDPGEECDVILSKGWVANAPVSDRWGIVGNVDVLFEKEKVVIEVDGYRAHSDRAAFQRDRSRQNRLTTAGYTVLRFTWRDLTETPARVLETVRRVI